MVITITTDSNNSILTSGCTTNTNLSNSIHHNDDNSQQRQENSEIKSITNDESPIEKQKMQNENQKHNDKKKQQHEEKQQELKIQIQSTKKIENYRNNIKNDTMIATPTIDIEIESDEEREEGEIIDEFEDISSDEEMLMMKRIEELEAKNAELEKIENISGIYDYDIDYIDDRYKKANTSSKYDYHSADDNDDCHNSKSYLISNKKRLTTSRRTSPLITVKYPLLPLEITANTSKDSNSKYHNHRHHHHHCHRHRHHHHHHRNHNRNEYKTIQSHHFDDIYDDVYGEKERVYIYDDDDNKSNDGLEYISQSSVSSIESIQPVKRRKRKRKYEKISKCVKRKTIKSGKKKKKLSRNHQIPAVASFNSDDEDNDCILDRDELRKALKRDVTTTTKTATATVTAKNSKNIQNYHRSNEKDSMINSKNNKKIRTIDLVSEEEKEDTNKIDNCIVVEENEKEPCDIEDESDDDSASLEEQELRLIALKSAIEHKHLTRKRRRESDEKRPYTPSDNFAEMFDSCINNDDDYNKDLYSFSPSDLDISPPPISSEITDTFANNSMDISPLSSPELIMSDNVGCDDRSAVSTGGGGVVYNDSTDSLLKPIDMELANSDSSNNPTPIFEQQQQQQNSSQQIYNFYDNNCWIPIEKIPLPQDYDVRQNQEIQQSHHIHCPTAMKLLPPKSSFQPLMRSITPSSLSSSPVLLQQQQQQLEHHQQQQKNINIDDNEKVVIRSASSLGSEKIDNADSTDEEELALRALLLANMNSKQKSKNQHNSSIEELIEEKNLENQSNNHSNDNNKENKPSIILKSYNAGDMKNCDIIADDSSTSSNDIEILKNLLLKTMNDMNYSNSNNDDRNLQQNHDENITHKTELVLKEAVKRLKQKSTTVTPVKENLQDNVQEQKQQQQQQRRLCDSKKSPSSFICFTNTTSILNENYINSTKDLLPDYNTNNDINISHNHNENDVEKMVNIFEKVHFDNNNRTELNYKKQKNSELLKNNDYDDEKNENLLNEIKNKKSDDISVHKRNSKCDQNLIKNTNKKKSITKSSLATTKSTTLLRPTLVTTTKTQSSSNKISDVENLNSNTTRMTKTRTKIINNHKNTASIIETTNTGPLSFVKKRKIVRTTTNRNEMAAVASSSSSASLAAAVSARAPLKITQNLKTGTRLITKAEIPKVEKIIIQLGVESSTSSAESSESESDHESDSNTNNCSKYNQNSTYNDSSIASPISLQMDSPVYSPIPNQNHQQSTLLDYQDQNQFENSNDNLEKNITNDIFQAKLDEFLKNARIKVEQTKKEVNTNEGVVGIGGNSSSSIGAGTSNAIKSNDDDDNNRTVSNEIDEKPAAATKAVKSNVLPLKAITTKTPVAVRHLPQSSQLEYRRLINRMKILEKQKLARHIKMNVNRDNLKGTMKEDETNRNDNVGITNESTTATSAATATGTVTGTTAVGIVTETEVGATTESASTTVPIKETTNQRLQILTDNSNSNNSNDDIMNSSKNEISKEFNQQKDKLIKKVLIKNASNVIATSLTESSSSSSSSVSVSHNKNDANDDENNLINTNIQKNEQENCSDTKETVIMNEINIESEISSNKLVKAQNENVHVNDIEMVDVEKTKDDDSTLPINKENDSVTNLEEEKKDDNMKIESISISSSSSSGNSNVDINYDDDKLTTKSQLTKVNKNNIELLKKYENEVNKKSCILNDSITKTIDLITIARKEKYHKFLLQKKFEHLKAQMQLIENDLNKQNLKLSKIYPDVMNSHKKIINIKTNYINLEKITMNLGRNIYGDDYRIENDNKKSIILNKSKQFSIEMKKLKDLKQSDLNENVTIEWKISNDNKKNNSNSSSSSSNNTTMMTVNDSKMMNDDNNQEFNLNTVKTIEVHTENLTKMDGSCSVVIEDSQSNCTIEKEENQLNEKCTVNGQQKENVLSSEVKTNDKMEIDLIENVENIQTATSKTTSIEEEDKINHRTETINIDKIVAVKNIESETILELSDKTTTEGEEQILQIADEDNSNLEKISNENVICESENYQKSNDDDNSRISSVEQNEEISNRKEQINENITNNMKSSLPSISSFTENSNDENNLIKSTDLVKNYVSPLDHIKQKRTIIDDPNGIICPYQLMGQCDDKECKFVHLPNNDA